MATRLNSLRNYVSLTFKYPDAIRRCLNHKSLFSGTKFVKWTNINRAIVSHGLSRLKVGVAALSCGVGVCVSARFVGLALCRDASQTNRTYFVSDLFGHVSFLPCVFVMYRSVSLSTETNLHIKGHTNAYFRWKDCHKNALNSSSDV